MLTVDPAQQGATSRRRNGQHVLMTQGRAVLSNDQMRDYLMCGPCEQRIGVYDNYVSQIACKADGTFAALSSATPTLNHLRTADSYAVDVSSLDTKMIVQFAASVFWRASVSARFPNMSLGRYEDQFRAFLHGTGDFPSDARLVLSIISTKGPPIDRVTTMPAGGRADAYHYEHVFVVAGLHFLLAVGGKLPPAFDLFCLSRSPLALVTSSGGIHDRLMSLGATAKAKGALAR